VATKTPRRGELVAVEDRPSQVTPSHIIAYAGEEHVQFRVRGTHGKDTLVTMPADYFYREFVWSPEHQLTGAWMPRP
jgi:hypothetical protein